MQGPITVFDEGTYAGDAQIGYLPPKGKRLISYAVDLETDIVARQEPVDTQTLAIQLLPDKRLEIRSREERATRYVIKNDGPRAKQVLIERALPETGWKLIEPRETVETTRSYHRFKKEVGAHESTELLVRLEIVYYHKFAIGDMEDRVIHNHVSNPAINEQAKRLLQDVLKLRATLTLLHTKLKSLSGEVGTIHSEQQRIRENASKIDHSSDLYKRYVEKLAEQETLLDKLQAAIKKANDAIAETQEQMLRLL